MWILLRFSSVFIKHNFINCYNDMVYSKLISRDSVKQTIFNGVFLEKKFPGTKVLLSKLPPNVRDPWF